MRASCSSSNFGSRTAWRRPTAKKYKVLFQSVLLRCCLRSTVGTLGILLVLLLVFIVQLYFDFDYFDSKEASAAGASCMAGRQVQQAPAELSSAQRTRRLASATSAGEPRN